MANEEEEKPDDAFYKNDIPEGQDAGDVDDNEADDKKESIDDKLAKELDAEQKKFRDDEVDLPTLPAGNVRKQESGVQAEKKNYVAAGNNVLRVVDKSSHSFTMLGGAAIVMVIVVLLGRKYLITSSRRQNKVNWFDSDKM